MELRSLAEGFVFDSLGSSPKLGERQAVGRRAEQTKPIALSRKLDTIASTKGLARNHEGSERGPTQPSIRSKLRP